MNLTNTLSYFYTTIQQFDLELIFTFYINTVNPLNSVRTIYSNTNYISSPVRLVKSIFAYDHK